MKTIYNWTAVRSGGAMTIEGRSVEGAVHSRVKITKVTSIEVTERGLIARQETPEGGEVFRLLSIRFESPAEASQAAA